eukprot:m.1137524 g.1137524  ORF g.1137524 m.1137524 type:complete len:116 (-) comp24435_c0_seq31:353-700(-)
MQIHHDIELQTPACLVQPQAKWACVRVGVWVWAWVQEGMAFGPLVSSTRSSAVLGVPVGRMQAQRAGTRMCGAEHGVVGLLRCHPATSTWPHHGINVEIVPALRSLQVLLVNLIS